MEMQRKILEATDSVKLADTIIELQKKLEATYEITKLREEVERLKAGCRQADDAALDWHKQLLTAQLEIKDLRDALDKVKNLSAATAYPIIEQALSKTYDDSALRSYVAEKIQQAFNDSNGYSTEMLNWAKRYERGEI